MRTGVHNTVHDARANESHSHVINWEILTATVITDWIAEWTILFLRTFFSIWSQFKCQVHVHYDQTMSKKLFSFQKYNFISPISSGNMIKKITLCYRNFSAPENFIYVFQINEWIKSFYFYIFEIFIKHLHSPNFTVDKFYHFSFFLSIHSFKTNVHNIFDIFFLFKWMEQTNVSK